MLCCAIVASGPAASCRRLLPPYRGGEFRRTPDRCDIAANVGQVPRNPVAMVAALRRLFARLLAGPQWSGPRGCVMMGATRGQWLPAKNADYPSGGTSMATVLAR